MLRQAVIYIILLYDMFIVAFILKKLFTIPGNKKLLNQYKKLNNKKKDKTSTYILCAVLFFLGLIYLCFF